LFGPGVQLNADAECPRFDAVNESAWLQEKVLVETSTGSPKRLTSISQSRSHFRNSRITLTATFCFLCLVPASFLGFCWPCNGLQWRMYQMAISYEANQGLSVHQSVSNSSRSASVCPSIRIKQLEIGVCLSVSPHQMVRDQHLSVRQSASNS
jgi:hypothetical protein